MKSLTEIYKSLKDKPLLEDINDDAQWLLRGELPAGIEQGTITKDSWSSLPQYHNLVKHLANNQKSDTIDFPEYGGISFKLLDNKDIEWSISSFPSSISPTGRSGVPEPRFGSNPGSMFKEEKVKIEIPGTEGKQEVKIKHKDVMTDEALKGVTITFSHEGDDVEQYTDIDFEYADDTGNDHENEGKDVIFAAEGDGMMFEVEVQVEFGYENSGNIQAIDWNTLTVTKDDKGESLDEQGCTEQEIEEGTCGYGVDGELGDEPAGPQLISIIQEALTDLKKS